MSDRKRKQLLALLFKDGKNESKTSRGNGQRPGQYEFDAQADAEATEIIERMEKANSIEEYKKLAGELNLDYLDLILHVGEDFELLFTISKENLEKLPIDCIVIGEVTDSDVIELTLENGFVERIKNKGYEHYVSE